MSVGKLKVTISIVIDVDSLEAWGAETLEEAASQQQRWFDDGDCHPTEFLEMAEDYTCVVEVADDC
jgi:hypothetical protein